MAVESRNPCGRANVTDTPTTGDCWRDSGVQVEVAQLEGVRLGCGQVGHDRIRLALHVGQEVGRHLGAVEAASAGGG